MEVSVGEFYHADERDDWVDQFLSSVPAVESKPSKTASVAAPPTATRAARVRLTRERDRLIPRTCFLRVRDGRVRRIENELRELSLETFPNAVSVLFRVFLELSVDWYISHHNDAAPKMKPTKQPGQTPRDPVLTAKIESVCNYLISKQQLSAQDGRPVRRACQRDSFLLPSIPVLNNYVHNFQMSPSPTDLRAHWDNLQPFVESMWPRQ